jgi:hypothetical protein
VGRGLIRTLRPGLDLICPKTEASQLFVRRHLHSFKHRYTLKAVYEPTMDGLV